MRTVLHALLLLLGLAYYDEEATASAFSWGMLNNNISINNIIPAARTYRAWTCHGSTNRELIDNLYKANIVKSSEVREAMLSVDRKNYIVQGWTDSAYDDTPLQIGHGQTISAPHMHAHAMEELLPALKRSIESDPTKPLKVLDVGCGSGYLSATLGRLLAVLGRSSSVEGDDGISGSRVYGIDCVPELVKSAERNMRKGDGGLLDSGVVSLSVADGWGGLPHAGPFQAVHVGAGAETLPKKLATQLDVGGRMVVPVETGMGHQALMKVDRRGGEPGTEFREEDFEIEELFPVRYVPLVHPNLRP